MGRPGAPTSYLIPLTETEAMFFQWIDEATQLLYDLRGPQGPKIKARIDKLTRVQGKGDIFSRTVPQVNRGDRRRRGTSPGRQGSRRD